MSSTLKDALSTPVLTLLQGRIAPMEFAEPPGQRRYDVGHLLRESRIPEPAQELIRHLVRKTRLWRRERYQVAMELAAHFADGLEAGGSMDELRARFGNPDASAKLIRRAKKRNRPLLWRVGVRAVQATCCLVATYFAAALLLLTSHPAPSVDYVATINATAASAPLGERAWPIYRNVFTELNAISKDELDQLKGREDGSQIGNVSQPGDANWPSAVALVHGHEAMLARLRQAAAKRHFGLVVGTASSFPADDYAALTGAPLPAASDMDQSDAGKLLQHASISVLLPHLAKMRLLAQMLQIDAMDAAIHNDGQRIVEDYIAMVGMARHCREHPILVSQLVCVGMCGQADSVVAWVNLNHPQALEAHRLALVHAAAAARGLFTPDIAAEQGVVLDMIQRMYSDSGNGDGHLTPAGLQVLSTLSGGRSSYPHLGSSYKLNGWLVAPAAAAVVASRRQATSMAEQCFDLARQELSEPLWVRLRHEPLTNRYLGPLRSYTTTILYYAPLVPILPQFNRAGNMMDQGRAVHDATMVALALDIYRQQTGRYPDSLGPLIPQYLPELPVDLSTGQVLLYRLYGGKPLLYGRGLDSNDDGGIWRPEKGCRWPAVPNQGDWILYPEPVGPNSSTQ